MSINLPRIKALCFDIDGTISDTDDLWVHRIERILQPFSRFFPGRQSSSFARWLTMSIESPGNTLYHLLDRAGLDDEVAGLISWISRHPLKHRQKTYWIIPQVKEVLIELSHHYPMGVVSARDKESTLAFLEHFDLISLFQDITTAHTCPLTKPFPDPVVWCARQLGVKPQECLMIGDTTVDIRAGKSAGAQTAGVLCGFGEENELLRAGADVILSSTADLFTLLMKH